MLTCIHERKTIGIPQRQTNLRFSGYHSVPTFDGSKSF